MDQAARRRAHLQKDACLSEAGVLSWMHTNCIKRRLVDGENGEGVRENKSPAAGTLQQRCLETKGFLGAKELFSLVISDTVWCLLMRLRG